MESFIRAFERGTGETHGQLVILLEWTATLEGAVSSLRISQLYDARMKALEAVAKRAVDPLPPPWKDERRVPIGWGVLKPEQETDYVPATWDEFWDREVFGIQRNLVRRWQEARAFELVYEEVAVAVGESLVHADVQQRLTWLRESVLMLNREMEELGHPFELPEPDAEQVEANREHWDWTVLRPPTDKHAREWLAGQVLEDTLAFEREQADALRKRS